MLIRERAEGHPFYAEEIGYALRDSGHLIVSNGQCRLRDQSALSHADVPATIEGLITSRIDRLQPAEQLTVKVASVIGRVFQIELLHDVYPVLADRVSLPAHLSALQQLDIAPVDTASSNTAYHFKHSITRKVAYDLMLREQRSELHQRIAEWFEQRHAAELTFYYPLLAHHWNQAGAALKAIDYLELAAEHAVNANANAEALAFLDQLDALRRSHPEVSVAPLHAAHLLQLRARACKSFGRLEDAKQAFSAALAILGEPFPTATTPIVGAVLKNLARQIWHRSVGAPRPPNDPDERRRLRMASTLSEELFLIFFFDNDVANILLSTLCAINLSERGGEVSQGLIRGYMSLAVALEAVPLRPLADSYARRALQVLGQQDTLAIRAWVDVAQAVLAAGRGQWQTAEQCSERALSIYRQLGDHRGWEEAAGNYQLIQTLYGRFEEPEHALYTQLKDAGLRHESLQVQGWAHSLLCTVLHHQQREPALSEALEDYRGFLAHETGFRDDITRLEGLGLLAQLRVRQQRLPDALAFVEQGARVIARLGLPSQYRNLPSAQLISEGAIEVARRLPANAQAQQWRVTTVAFVGSCARAYPLAGPKLAWLRGKLAWYAGKRGTAQRYWQRSLTLARRLQMPYDVLLVQAARAHLTQDAEAGAEALALQARLTIGVPYEVQSMLIG